MPLSRTHTRLGRVRQMLKEAWEEGSWWPQDELHPQMRRGGKRANPPPIQPWPQTPNVGSGGMFGMGPIGQLLGAPHWNAIAQQEENERKARELNDNAMKNALKEHLDAIKASASQSIVAWRGWNVDNGRLTSVGIGTVSWPTRRLFSAVCQRQSTHSGPGPHNAPHQGCTCGVYGFATLPSLAQVKTSAVLGRVQLGGEVVVCAQEAQVAPCTRHGVRVLDCGDCTRADAHPQVLGYRAELAYPSLLFTWPTAEQMRGRWSSVACSHNSNDGIKQLAADYGVECAPLPDELIEAFWPRDPKATEPRNWPNKPLSTQTYAAAQAAHLQQMMQGQQNLSNLGALHAGLQNQSPWAQMAAQQYPGAPSPVSFGDPTTWGGQQADAHTHYIAKLLGIEIATPSTIALHDALSAQWREQNKSEGKDEKK